MSAPTPSAQARFSTFAGVFTPCVLTILGVIMFMRSGYVVGDVGLWRALAILAIAKGITTLTTLSLSAIATNTEVKTGGVYFMISRTLGADFGGAIGLTLFVSQAVSVAFYVIGFTEALFALGPADAGLTEAAAAWSADRWASTTVILMLFAVTFRGADVAIRAQYVILVVLLVSVVSFLIGGLLAFSPSQLADNAGINPAGADGFWIAFAIFFPAATGITAGANLSGDLKNPARSIPRGTLAAIAFTAVIYLLQLVFLAGYQDQAALRENPFGAIKSMSLFAPLVVAGVFAATLSSALGSFLGAPRILQAMGKDRLLAPLLYFGYGHGPADEPRRATVLTLGIALAVVWAGSLDAVAQVISMFFLIAYGMINLSAFVEGRSGNPSFRPTFKRFGWPAALVGTVACVLAMVKINETYAVVAMVIAGGIYLSLRGRRIGNWGDAKRGYVFTRTRENLLLLENMPPDPKNWRPVLAVLTDDAAKDRHLITCASWVESKRGLLSVLEVTGGDVRALEERMARRYQRSTQLSAQLQARQIVAFCDSVVVPQPEEQLDAVLQAYSIGTLRPNTIMMSAPPPSQPDRRARMAARLRTVAAFGQNVIVYKGSSDPGDTKRRIDLWWHGQRNGSLLALVAYLTNSHPEWQQARIRMLRVVNSGVEHFEAEQNLRDLMIAARLNVDIDVILSQRPISELIVERSGSADLLLLGLRRQDLFDFEAFLAARDPMLTQLPRTLLVWSNGEVDLLA